MRSIQLFFELITIIIRRLREQGVRTTLHWMYAVGIPKLTGSMSLRYSRVTPHLFIGSQYGKRGLQTLQSEGIAASVNLREEYDDAEHGLSLTDHAYIPIADNTAPSLDNLEDGVRFIRAMVAEGGKVYVHCGSGVGRAPTMAAAYLISEGASVDEAVARITNARPFVRILPNQMEILREHAPALRALGDVKTA
ncbi:MAG: dual specificity protein phosphatase family protein [Anaerolineales bacterium]